VAAHNLFVVHLDARELLKESSKSISHCLSSRAPFEQFHLQKPCGSGAGLKEFYFLARLQQLAERKGHAGGTAWPDYEILIWDALPVDIF